MPMRVSHDDKVTILFLIGRPRHEAVNYAGMPAIIRFLRWLLRRAEYAPVLSMKYFISLQRYLEWAALFFYLPCVYDTD